MFNPFKRDLRAEKEPDWTLAHYEFLSRIFGSQEANNHLLNVVQPTSVTSDMVLADSQAMESMMSGKGWSVYEKAVWFKLLTALRLNLAAKTLEEREANRNQVLALLGCLHLPYEMRFAADNIKKMKEFEKSAKAVEV